MFLPILLLLSTLCSLISNPTPVLAAAINPESVLKFDTQNPAWGEEIIFERSGKENPDGSITIENGEISVGPEGRIKFPDLTELTDSIIGALPSLLPENLVQDFKMPEEITLKGKIYHPVCDVLVKGESRDIAGNKPSANSTTVDTLPYWSRLVGLSKLAQAIGVPGASSGVQFETKQPDYPGEDPNISGGCKEEKGTIREETQAVPATGFTTINFNLFEKLKDIIGGILRGGEPTQAQIIVRPKKLIPGEKEFSQQVSDKMGFLRSFCPDNLCPKEINELEETRYQDEDDNTKNLEYQGVAGAREGYELLVQSLYPAELQGIIALRPGGASYTYPQTSDTLDFTIPYKDVNFSISDDKKQEIINAVLRSWPSSNIKTLWDTVVAESKSAGVNPAFTLAIWIEEGGAGGAGAWSEFGCFPGGDTNQTVTFNRSLQCFLYFTSVEHPNDFTEWMRYFCGPKAQPICSNNPGFIGRLKYWWGQFNR